MSFFYITIIDFGRIPTNYLKIRPCDTKRRKILQHANRDSYKRKYDTTKLSYLLLKILFFENDGHKTVYSIVHIGFLTYPTT